MYLLYNSLARAPLATIPSTLFSQSDCMAYGNPDKDSALNGVYSDDPARIKVNSWT